MDERIIRARQFCLEVRQLAQRYGLPFFLVTDGASAISNDGCDAVDCARKAHVEWETQQGIDPDHEWRWPDDDDK